MKRTTSREDSPITKPSSPSIIQQQTPIQYVLFQNRDEIIQALNQPDERLKKLHLNGVYLNGCLIWLLIKANLERIHLQNCKFDPNGPVDFPHLFEFLTHSIVPQTCSKLAIQFNNCMTQWTICYNVSNPELLEHEHIGSLLFILSDEIPQQLLLDDISSLAVLPPNLDSKLPGALPSFQDLSSQSEKNLKSIMCHQYPGLRRLLLAYMNSDEVMNYIPIPEMKLDLIYAKYCNFNTTNPIWSSLSPLIGLGSSMHPGQFLNVHFTVPFHGHTTQIVCDDRRFDSPTDLCDPVNGLVLSLEQNVPCDTLPDDTSFLILLASKMDSIQTWSPQLKQILKSINNLKYPRLKYILLKNINFSEAIEDYIPISQMKLDSIYLWNCHFWMKDPIWSILTPSTELLNSIPLEETVVFQFALPFGGYTTQIVCDDDPSKLMSFSISLFHGLITPLEWVLPTDLLVDNIHFLIILPPEMTPDGSFSSRSKQNLNFITGNQWPNLKYVFLKDMPPKYIGEMANFFREHKLGVFFL
jgi:hypothetical protein